MKSRSSEKTEASQAAEEENYVNNSAGIIHFNNFTKEKSTGRLVEAEDSMSGS